MDMAGNASARAVKRIEDVLQAAHRAVPRGRRQHGPPGAARQPTSAINNFYTPTVYEKGAEVVRMMHTLVGRDGFAQGPDAVLPAPRRPGRDLRRLCPGHRRCQPGHRCWPRSSTASSAGTRAPARRGSRHAATTTPRRSATRCSCRSSCPAAADGRADADPGADGAVRARRPARCRCSWPTSGAATARRALLVLDQAERSWSFVDVASEPVPSLLRGFSAPVMLDDGLGDAALLTLLAHDTDPFNRWEAGQRLSLRRLLAALQSDTAAGAGRGLSCRRCAACCATRSSTRPSRPWCWRCPARATSPSSWRWWTRSASTRCASRCWTSWPSSCMPTGPGPSNSTRCAAAMRRSAIRRASARWPAARWPCCAATRRAAATRCGRAAPTSRSRTPAT